MPVTRNPYDCAVADRLDELESHVRKMLAGGDPDGILSKVNALQSAIVAALVSEGPGTDRYRKARDELATVIASFDRHRAALDGEKSKAKGGKTMADVRAEMTGTARAYRMAGWLVERKRDCSYRHRRTKDDPWSPWVRPYTPKRK
jgi:hypothetical protein